MVNWIWLFFCCSAIVVRNDSGISHLFVIPIPSHQVPKYGGYFCPQCHSKFCELPIDCSICGLTLISSPQLARSYHHLFPVSNFTEVSSPFPAVTLGTQRWWGFLFSFKEPPSIYMDLILLQQCHLARVRTILLWLSTESNSAWTIAVLQMDESCINCNFKNKFVRIFSLSKV